MHGCRAIAARRRSQAPARIPGQGFRLRARSCRGARRRNTAPRAREGGRACEAGRKGEPVVGGFWAEAAGRPIPRRFVKSRSRFAHRRVAVAIDATAELERDVRPRALLRRRNAAKPRWSTGGDERFCPAARERAVEHPRADAALQASRRPDASPSPRVPWCCSRTPCRPRRLRARRACNAARTSVARNASKAPSQPLRAAANENECRRGVSCSVPSSTTGMPYFVSS